MHYSIYLVLNTFPAPSEHFGVHVGTEVEVLTPKLVGGGGEGSAEHGNLVKVIHHPPPHPPVPCTAEQDWLKVLKFAI